VTSPIRKATSRTADVWLIDVDDPHFLEAAGSSLAGPDDHARALALSDADAGRRLLARQATLRLILARYVEPGPAELRIVTAPGGKPVLLTGPAFSVAHSGSLLAVAVSGTSSVGVDIEHRRPVTRAQAIADRWFGEGEARALAAAPDGTRDDVFLQLWTAKEALAKRHGAGLRLMKGRGTHVGEALDVAASLSDASLAYFDAGAEYVAALALNGPIEHVDVLTPSEELWTI
jgi:4'-phosphopantetheinyl transferase